MTRYRSSGKRSNRRGNTALTFLYRTVPGRVCLKVAAAPVVSRVIGKLLDTPASAVIIDPFVKRAGIDVSLYEKRPYKSYNDFFTRALADGARTIDKTPSHLISPCDGQLSVYDIGKDSVFYIKNSPYSLSDLLHDEALAEEFSGGFCLIFRLRVDDYHRYIFFDDGRIEATRYIKGILHTVRPVAFERYNVYKQNCREYSIMQTKNFGKAVQVEVGAMLVGKIVNRKNVSEFSRGEEKGHFEYGGSTIVLLLKSGAAEIDDCIRESSRVGFETEVKLGQKIGTKERRF